MVILPFSKLQNRRLTITFSRGRGDLTFFFLRGDAVWRILGFVDKSDDNYSSTFEF